MKTLLLLWIVPTTITPNKWLGPNYPVLEAEWYVRVVTAA
jgi:hypothetical protein